MVKKPTVVEKFGRRIKRKVFIASSVYKLMARGLTDSTKCAWCVKRDPSTGRKLCRNCILKDTHYLPAGSSVEDTTIRNVAEPIVLRKYDEKGTQRTKMVVIGAYGGVIKQCRPGSLKMTLIYISDAIH